MGKVSLDNLYVILCTWRMHPNEKLSPNWPMHVRVCMLVCFVLLHLFEDVVIVRIIVSNCENDIRLFYGRIFKLAKSLKIRKGKSFLVYL